MADNSNNMHFGAFGETFRRANLLRKHMTEAELLLWNEIKSNKLDGYKFRRQHLVGRFIVDFYCHKAKLIIELDGEIHNEPEIAENDKEREKELISLGLKILRFSNKEVKENIQNILAEIRDKLSQNLATL
ncbi:MAG: endonuclease domain-containing protein [Saprospiraceae bacterium]|nr:endonuclease domain-containing protein [Saprospiraceae bacterium]